MRRWLLPLLAATALTACTSLEPPYVQPASPVPPSWPVGDAYLRQSEASLPTVGYRDIFRDPKLQALIAQALGNSRDLRIAAANIASARAQYRIQRAERLPRVDVGADVGLSRSGGSSDGGAGSGGDGTGTGGSGGGIRQSYGVDIGLSAFELDLFGRVRSLSNAALQQYFATEAGARATRLSLVAEVAAAYVTLASDRSLLAIARDTESNARRSVELTGARLRGGIAPRTDLRQAETVLFQAVSDIAELTAVVAQDRNALQLLVGAPVDDTLLPSGIESVDPLLGELPAGLNSRILLRRPDVVQAEYLLRAANARIGAARAAFFPTISLTALTGLASNALGSLFSSDAFNFRVAPSLSLPIFDAGGRRANLAFTQAQRQLALAQYERAIQVAFREVSDALARRGTIGAQAAAQTSLVASARDNYVLTNARYRGGIDTFLTSLDAQRTLYSAQQNLVLARRARAENLVVLYRSLGGDSLMEVPEQNLTNGSR
ncbi:MAG TPA: efflux transporter outer membrane subunit [Sphingomonadaceae bacterium]|nr:efflux transporter outer membrane subunit [Sphingomonadaceae bacterium]